jgi:hypothetical protein
VRKKTKKALISSYRTPLKNIFLLSKNERQHFCIISNAVYKSQGRVHCPTEKIRNYRIVLYSTNKDNIYISASYDSEGE